MGESQFLRSKSFAEVLEAQRSPKNDKSLEYKN